MESFITGHLIGKNVDAYCGCNDKFVGKVVGCSDGVLTLETDGGIYTHIAIDKIIAIWNADERKAKTARKPKKKT